MPSSPPGLHGGFAVPDVARRQIDKYGIGNGVRSSSPRASRQLPNAVGWIASNFDASQSAESGKIGIMAVVFLAASFVFVTAGAILITVAQRRIPIQQAKHTRGRKVVGGQKHYLPLRINHAGVMPIIFASSLMISVLDWVDEHRATQGGLRLRISATNFLAENFQIGMYSTWSSRSP